MKTSRTHYVIFHRYRENDPSSSRIPDLEIDVEDAERLVRDDRLLTVFKAFIKALNEEDLELTVTGEDDE